MTGPGPLRADRATVADLLLWVATRGVLLMLVLGAGHWPQRGLGDLDIYRGWVADSLRHGRFPTDSRWQYPPLIGPVLRLADYLPGWWGYVLLFLAFDAAIMLMLCWHAQRLGLGTGRRLWALVPFLVGPLLLSRFDVLPTAFAVGALMLASRPVASGAVSAIGAWIKIWPILALAGLRRRDLPQGLLGALIASAVVAATLAASTTDALSFLRNEADRGLQIESVAAYPFLIARRLGLPVGLRYQFGAQELTGNGVATVSTLLPWATVLLLSLVLVQRFRGRLDELPPADVAVAAVLISVVTSRVGSPQYYIWVLGLGAVSLCHPTTRMRPTIALVAGASLAAQFLYPWLYDLLLDGSPVALGVQTVRVALTLAAGVTAILVVLRPELTTRTERPHHPSTAPHHSPDGPELPTGAVAPG